MISHWLAYYLQKTCFALTHISLNDKDLPEWIKMNKKIKMSKLKCLNKNIWERKWKSIKCIKLLIIFCKFYNTFEYILLSIFTQMENDWDLELSH